jgi:hypothetical protein
MLDQRLSTIPQHSWVDKLFGYDFRVEYRAGRLNVVADALSRRHSEDLTLAVVSTPSFQFYDDLRREIDSSSELTALRQTISWGEHEKHWSVTDGLIRRDGKVLVPSSSPLL